MILGMYDVSGIQNYIFSSSKLKENVGASLQVQKILEDELVNVLQNYSDHHTAITHDWKKADEFRMVTDETIGIEIIYIGGGNALVAFRSKELYETITEELSRKVFHWSYGLLKVTSAWVEVNKNQTFADHLKCLYQELRKVKARIFQSYPLNGIGINVTTPLDGFVTDPEDSDNKSYVSVAKLNAFKKYKNEYEKRLKLPEILNGLEWPLDFDKINPEEAKRYIAVVHIDGNSMGKTIINIMNKAKDFISGVITMRKLSAKISEHYEKAMIDTIHFLSEKLDSYDYHSFDKDKDILKDYLKLKEYFPLRILILNGDDITFVTHGKLGISLTKKFLENIEKNPLELSIDGNRMSVQFSACAGVAIVKSHFPFYKAYQLAEELASNSKNRAKNKPDGKAIQSYMDVHVVQTGVTTDLDTIRERYYKKNGKLLPGRPWLISPVNGNALDNINYHFKQFEETFHHFFPDGDTSTKKWPRSRLKALRNAFLMSEDEMRVVILSAKSRGYQLPQPVSKEIIFDVLELMDLYVHL